jgi:hypothetical protein
MLTGTTWSAFGPKHNRTSPPDAVRRYGSARDCHTATQRKNKTTPKNNGQVSRERASIYRIKLAEVSQAGGCWLHPRGSAQTDRGAQC